MRIYRVVCLGMLLLAARLQGQTHDLELRIHVDSPPVTPPGSTGVLTLTVINHGPDPAGFDGIPGTFRILVSGGPLAYSFDYGDLIYFTRLSDISTCRLTASLGDPLPGEPVPVFYTLRFEKLAPGESVSCDVEFQINPYAYMVDPRETGDGDIVHRWTAGSTTGVDPDPSNNRIYVTYQLTTPSAIPTLGPWGLAILSLALVASYALVHRRASPC